MAAKNNPGSRDKRVDIYIDRAADFAKPILKHFREAVHKSCPEAEEKIKWGFPHFDYKGEMMCSMAAFKQHCAFTFWKASLMKKNKSLELNERSAMGHLGKITALSDLPSDKELKSLIKEAVLLNDKGIKIKKTLPLKSEKKEIKAPDYFIKILNKNKKAGETFNAFSPSHKREYVEWITEAKTEATRDKRIATALEWLAEGKSRNWKYIKK